MAGSRKSYTIDQKINIVKKLLGSDKPIEQVANEEGVSLSSLHRWKKEFKEEARTDKTSSQNKIIWTSNDKFRIVMETYSMTEIELGDYCRSNGLYREQIIEWKKACISANDTREKQDKAVSVQLKEEQKSKRELEKELRKKEKALAEMAALLVLSKKANAIWGEPEED